VDRPRWGAVFALALCVAVLIASEFMPVSLLSPIALELGLTEGQAGQAISISGVFAVITSLSIARATRGLNRRLVLLSLTGLMVISGGVVAFAPDYLTLMAGRALLGVTIGGFWSMSAAMVMRLVPIATVPKGLAIIYGGNALAVAIAAPLGSFMGGIFGWRGAFFCVVPIGVAAWAWQYFTLPSLPPRDRQDGGMLQLLKTPLVALGMTAVALSFMGQFALFTYLRPFLEQVTGVDVQILSTMLLVVGLTGLIGTWLVGLFLDHRLHAALTVIPVLMAMVALALAAFGAFSWVVAALLAAWGVLSTAAPVAWSTWLTRTLPDNAEAGGGLMVAVIQLGITIGATVGGLVFDGYGGRLTFVTSAGILILSGLLALAASRAGRRKSPGAADPVHS
jgi:predicted MFS family arabinose efflux permease